MTNRRRSIPYLLDASTTVWPTNRPSKLSWAACASILSSTSKLHGADLYVLENDGNNLRLLDYDKEHDAPPIPIGTRIPCAGAAAEVIERRSPFLFPTCRKKCRRFPIWHHLHQGSVGRSTYLFPVSTLSEEIRISSRHEDARASIQPRRRRMLGSMAAHVAVASGVRAGPRQAEQYQRELVSERDRLRLCLRSTTMWRSWI